MTDVVPIPAAGPPPDPVQLAALARAASLIVSDLIAKSKDAPLTREDVEMIVAAALAEMLRDLGYGATPDDIKALRSTLEHAERSRAFWREAGSNVMKAVWTAVGGGLLAVGIKYLGGSR